MLTSFVTGDKEARRSYSSTGAMRVGVLTHCYKRLEVQELMGFASVLLIS
jgi:hypothetical protein